MADGQDQRFVDDDLGGQVRGQRGADRDQRHVQAASAQRPDESVGACLGQRDLEAGVVVMEAGQQAGQVEARGRDRADDAHGQVPAGQPGQRVRGIAHRGHRRQGGPGVGQHRSAGLGDPHRAAGAVKENLAEFSFQPADLRAHAGLGDMGLGGGLGEARLVGHRHEVLQLPQLHN